MKDPVVTAEWLGAHLDDVVVLDATYYLPPDPERSRAEFGSTRIPGARLFEVDKIADHSSDLPHMLPSAADFASAAAELGIDGERPVVVYDRSANHFSSPRVWFTLRVFGLAEVYVLSGGLTAWIAAGYPTESGPASIQPATPGNWTLEAARVVTGEQVAKDIASQNSPIIDARSEDRFAGTAPEPRPGLSSGHMRGGRCVPFAALTLPDGNFADSKTLQTLFGVFAGTEPIVTCGSGMTACVLALGLARIGIKARLYDGSWAEWGRGEIGEILADPN